MQGGRGGEDAEETNHSGNPSMKLSWKVFAKEQWKGLSKILRKVSVWEEEVESERELWGVVRALGPDYRNPVL